MTERIGANGKPMKKSNETIQEIPEQKESNEMIQEILEENPNAELFDDSELDDLLGMDNLSNVEDEDE